MYLSNYPKSIVVYFNCKYSHKNHFLVKDNGNTVLDNNEDVIICASQLNDSGNKE